MNHCRNKIELRIKKTTHDEVSSNKINTEQMAALLLIIIKALLFKRHLDSKCIVKINFIEFRHIELYSQCPNSSKRPYNYSQRRLTGYCGWSNPLGLSSHHQLVSQRGGAARCIQMYVGHTRQFINRLHLTMIAANLSVILKIIYLLS